MPGTDTDAKEASTEEIGGVVGEGSSTSHLDMEHVSEDSDNLISTIDDDGSDDLGAVDISSGGARDQGATEAESAKDEETETDTTEKVETKVDVAKVEDETKADITIEKIPEQFDKHPAWQRLISKIDGLETKLGEKEAVPETKTDTDIVDIDTLTEEEIAEWQTDDPKGYAKNFQLLTVQKSKDIIRAELKQEEADKKMANTFDTYADENADNESGTGFMQMWNSGQLQTYIDQNPGHNAISAHLKLTETSKAQSIQEQIDAGIAAGVAAEKKRLAAETKARVRTTGLGQGPAYTATDTSDDELKDTKKRGGKIAVMADRLKRMRQGAQA